MIMQRTQGEQITDRKYDSVWYNKTLKVPKSQADHREEGYEHTGKTVPAGPVGL